MDELRQSARISKLDIKPMNILIYLRKMDAPDTILKEINQKQLIWYGHVERMDPKQLPKNKINWKPEGKKNESVPEKPGTMGYIQL
jgi:hypothetical protein